MNNTERLKNLNDDKAIQNMIAQAHSRYILFNTAESKQNFPAFSINDDSLSILGLYYLEIGSSFAEKQNLEEGREPLERGASILEHVHCAENNRTDLSPVYCLISAMAYYVSFQYSKSYILIKKTASSSVIAKLISYFLQRKYRDLDSEIDRIMVDEAYQDDAIANMEDELSGADKVYETVIAKSLNGFVRYFESGEIKFLEDAKRQLKIIKEIAELKNEPGIWWVIRLLLLIADGFSEAALWNVLRNYFDPSSEVLQKYIRSLVYQPDNGIYELFVTQRKSLSKVLNPESSGCVVTIPTSSGKTRIAEISIVNSLMNDHEGKVLYIAPYRSLAFEIEGSLERILGNVGFHVSHLYGGSLFSKLDEKIIDESHVIIATPEKAKAIIRGNREIAGQIKLVIIDEGHLLGNNRRLIINEMFYEELRYVLEQNSGRFLLLSAVLPNSRDLSNWLTKSDENVYKDSWRPSDERFGILDWNGESVSLDWMNNDEEARPSFNRRFIVREQLPLVGRQRIARFMPADKNEAIAATTYKLRTFGVALIFVGLKASVFKMAEAYLKCLGTEAENFNYKNADIWKAYELACIETYGEDNSWLNYARKGILCHHGALHTDVRLPLERLMRSDKPHVIIATSTLGQGVNLGVSTVVFASLFQGGNPINERDFWNIAGRAGRAFIDNEGKILVAMDTSSTSSLFRFAHTRFKKNRAIEQHRKLIKKYFDRGKMGFAVSGVLQMLIEVKSVAQEAEVPFDLLLQLITENRIEELGDTAKVIENKLDLIDDSLLSLHTLNGNILEGNYSWIESFFKNSLAYLQVKDDMSLSKEEFLSFVDSRIKGIVQKVGEDPIRWQTIIMSGIPLNSDLFIEEQLDNTIASINKFRESIPDIEGKIQLLKELIDILSKAPVLDEDQTKLENSSLSDIVSDWIMAKPISAMLEYDGAEDIITDLFSFKLPWLLNGVSKKLAMKDMPGESALIEEVSILLETGLPSVTAVKIYQAGIRSRVSATELSKFFEVEFSDQSIRWYKFDITFNAETYIPQVTKTTGEWISLLSTASTDNSISISNVDDFSFEEAIGKTDILVSKEINGKQYLVSPDFSFISPKLEFGQFSNANNIPGVFFKHDESTDNWGMVVENPYIRVYSD